MALEEINIYPLYAQESLDYAKALILMSIDFKMYFMGGIAGIEFKASEDLQIKIKELMRSFKENSDV